MSAPIFAVVFAAASAASAPPPAPPPPAITAAGDAAEALITVRGVEAIRSDVRATGSDLIIDLADEAAGQAAQLDDATVKRAEVVGGANAHLMLQLEQPAAPLAKDARVEITAGGLVVHVPRHPLPVPAAAPPPPPAPEAAATLPPPQPPSTAPALPRGFLVVAGLLACALILARVLPKRRRAKATTARRIEVLATTPLGGKTRAVLMQVGDTEMLVAVNDAGTRLIGSWPAGDKGEPEPDDLALPDEPAPRAEGSVVAPRPRPSPAIAGLLKMKKDLADTGLMARVRHYAEELAPRTSAPTRASGYATAAPPLGGDGDSDDSAAWARELVRAARRGGQLS
jgi:flagellar biosynthesis protein FliO